MPRQNWSKLIPFLDQIGAKKHRTYGAAHSYITHERVFPDQDPVMSTAKSHSDMFIRSNRLYLFLK